MTRAARYQQRRRNAARVRGDCLTCCKRAALPGTTRCEQCKAWHRKYMNAYYVPLERKPGPQARGKSAHWCDECQSAGAHRNDCSTKRWRAA